MSGVGTPWAVGQPVSDLDRAEIRHYPDGRREIVYAEPMDVARERERQRREFAAEAARERQARADHDKRVAERVKVFLTSSEPEPAPDARAALVRHLDRIERARRLAAAAHVRAAEVEHAVARRDGAQTALDRLEAETAASFRRWLDFGSEGVPPATRDIERQTLLQDIAEAGPLAGLALAAAFEVAVADAVCEALEAMTPGLRADLLFEVAQPITERVRTLIAELSRAYGALSALASVTGRRNLLPPPRPIALPALPSGAVSLAIEAAEPDQAVWRTALADIEANANATIALPPDTPLPPPPPRRGPFFSRRS